MSQELPWGLFPAPRHVEEVGEGLRSYDPEVSYRTAPELPAEGYELSIGPRGIDIRHADAAGMRYASGALAQLREHCEPDLPGLRIRDWPDFPVRGYMLDISRDRVPTRETLERIVDLLELFRINQLQLYTEHTFAYVDHEEVWCDASPMTPEDVRWLDDFCRQRGVELVANQNGFGHMGRWLSCERYRSRAEAPEGWTAPWGASMSPGVLAPTPDNADFVLRLMRELLPNFKSRRINIGCDETFELGQGVSRAEVERRGRGEVYLEFLNRLLRGLHADGCEVQFWGDIVRQYPELVSSLPRENTLALVWHYEAPVEGPIRLSPVQLKQLEMFGVSEATLRGFVGQVAPFVESDVPYWVCPGTSTWNSLIGRLPNALANMRDAAEVGGAQGARGYLITDWGDNGHMAPPSIGFAPLAYGAAVAWCLESNRDIDVVEALNESVFEDRAGELGGVIRDIGELFSRTGIHTPNGSPLQFALIRKDSATPFQTGAADRAGLQDVLERLADAETRVARSQPRCGDGELVRREIAQALRMARHGAWLLQRSAGFECPKEAELRDDLLACIEEQRATWLARSRPGGLEDSIARLLWARS